MAALNSILSSALIFEYMYCFSLIFLYCFYFIFLTTILDVSPILTGKIDHGYCSCKAAGMAAAVKWRGSNKVDMIL